MLYRFDSNLNQEASLKYTPIPQIEAGDCPKTASWLDPFAYILATPQKDFQRGFKRIKQSLERHIQSSYPHRQELKEGLYIIYRALKRPSSGPLEKIYLDSKANLIAKLTEDIDACSEGFHIRVGSILSSLQCPLDLFQLLFKVRMSLVHNTAIQLTSAVHAYNHCFKIASIDGLGVTALSSHDPYHGDVPTDTIRAALRRTFAQEYCALRLPNLMCDELRNVFALLGYEGKKEEGYAFEVYKEIKKYCKAFIPDKISYDEFFILHDDTGVIMDINWKFIKDKLFNVMHKRNIILKDRGQIIPKNLIDYAQHLEFIQDQNHSFKLKNLLKEIVKKELQNGTRQLADIRHQYPHVFVECISILKDYASSLTQATIVLKYLLALTPAEGYTQKDDIEFIQALLKKGINPNLKDKNGDTLLMVAIRTGHIEIAQELLQQVSNLNLSNQYRHTGLIRTVYNGYIQIIQKLLNKKWTDLNLIDKNGNTALMIAAYNGHVEIVQALLNQEGIDLNSINKDGKTALMIAADNGHVKIVQALLQQEGIDLNSMSKRGNTALMLAAYNGHIEIAQELLQQVSNLNLSNQYRHTGLIRAVYNGYIQIIQKLLNKKWTDLNLINKNGDTALMLAAYNGHVKIIQALLNQEGIDLNSINKNGKTALMMATYNNHVEIVQALLQVEIVQALLPRVICLLNDNPVHRLKKDLIKKHMTDWCQQNLHHNQLQPLTLLFNDSSPNMKCCLALNSLIQALSKGDKALMNAIDTLLQDVRKLPEAFSNALAQTKVNLQLNKEQSIEEQLETIKERIKSKPDWETRGLFFSRRGSSKPRSANKILHLIEEAKKDQQRSKEALIEIKKILLLKSNGINLLTSNNTRAFYKKLYSCHDKKVKDYVPEAACIY